METWSVHDVVAWLQDIKLTDLVETMKENLICGVDLLELTGQMLCHLFCVRVLT